MNLKKSEIRKFTFIYLSCIFFITCSEKNKADNSIKNDKVEYYFELFKTARNEPSTFDTFYLLKKSEIDSVYVLEYFRKNDSISFRPQIDPIHFIIRNESGLTNIIPGITKHSDWKTNKLSFLMPDGTTEDLFETMPLYPGNDELQIGVMSPKYGLILAHSPPWRNYYYSSGCSDIVIERRMQHLIRLYLMKKGTYLDEILSKK